MMQSPSSNDSRDIPPREDCTSQREEESVQRLLFIDDDAAILDGYKFIFECEGFIVDVAGDSERTLELVRDNHYSVIVMDYTLPGITGVELAEQIHRINSSIDLILISGQKGIEDEINGRGINVSGVFMKPLKIETLIDFIIHQIDRVELKTIL